MKAKMSKWFETKVEFEKIIDDGSQKKVKEAYTVDALSFTEAEERITEEISSYISGEFTVRNLAEASYKEIFFSDLPSADKWYKAKLQFITLDEKTEKEKRSNVYYLVQAANFMQAVKNIEEVMGTTMIDYVIASVAETAIMDVFVHGVKNEETVKPEYEQQ